MSRTLTYHHPDFARPLEGDQRPAGTAKSISPRFRGPHCE